MEGARPRLYYRRKLFEALGLARYSRPALDDLDRKLQRYLAFDGGFFVEAGANDGFTQSNTYYLEKMRGWRGVLVEPLPGPYESCRRERRRSRVFRCALVDPTHRAPTVPMLAANLTSLVRGAQKDDAADQRHVHLGAACQEIERVETLDVPARTLTSVLDEARAPRIDFMSLDVEGYELRALQGLDLERYLPRYLLVEARFREEIDAFVAERYETVEQLSHHDVLYRARDR